MNNDEKEENVKRNSSRLSGKVRPQYRDKRAYNTTHNSRIESELIKEIEIEEENSENNKCNTEDDLEDSFLNKNLIEEEYNSDEDKTKFFDTTLHLSQSIIEEDSIKQDIDLNKDLYKIENKEINKEEIKK